MNDSATAVVPVRDLDMIPRLALTVDEALDRLKELARFIDAVFEEGVHYGKLPDMDKPMVYKPGVELLLQIHSLGSRLETLKEVEDWEAGFFYYRIKAIIFDKRTGNLVTEGMGSCSSKETRYWIRWLFERELPPNVDKDTLKYKDYDRKDGSGSFRKYQWKNENLADQQNTIMKMAIARALRDAGLRATFCSSLFTDKGTDWLEADYEVIDAQTGEKISKRHQARPVGKPQRPQQQARPAYRAETSSTPPQPPPAEAAPPPGPYIHPADKPPACDENVWYRWCGAISRAADLDIGVLQPLSMDTKDILTRLNWLVAEISKRDRQRAAAPPPGAPAKPTEDVVGGEQAEIPF